MTIRFMTIWLLFISFFCSNGYSSEDPWADLRKRFPDDGGGKIIRKQEADPWRRLQAIYLPFTEEEEIRAVGDRERSHNFSGKINRKLLPFAATIHMASRSFDVPSSIISSVIMAESGGNPEAKAGMSSAKGLMQIIDATFKLARNALSERDIYIKDNPFDPHASIMAGTWYLDQMYQKAVRDNKIGAADRKNLLTWKYPLEYYYAGPGNGKKNDNKIIVYSNGKKRHIDKSAYSRKILRWAGILDEGG